MSAPKDMVELVKIAQDMARFANARGGVEATAIQIAELGVAYERRRIAQQIRNQLRVLPDRRKGEPCSSEALAQRMMLEMLLAYVEDDGRTVLMGGEKRGR